MGLKGKIEAVIYAAEEPVTVEQISLLVKQAVLQELAEEQARAAAAAASEAEVEKVAAESQGSEFEPERNGEGVSAEPLAEAESGEAGEQISSVDEPAAIEELREAVDGPEVSTPEPTAEEGDTSALTGDGAAELVTPEATEQSASEQPSGAEQQSAPEPLAEAAESVPATVAPKRKPKSEIAPEVKARVREILEELIADYVSSDRGMEIRRIAGGFRMATKPEHHDVVKAFAKSLKPPLRLSLPALETLAVVAYKQPVTAPEVSEIRGVDSQGVVATLLDRKLITTAGRKAVIGRPILYKTTKEFLLRFGLKDVSELPSMEEFEKLAQEAGQVDMFEPEEEVPAGASTLHEVEPALETEAAVEGDAGSDTTESVVREQVGEQQGEAGGQEPPSERVREVPGDYASGADTAESVTRAQVEREPVESTGQPASEESIKS